MKESPLSGPLFCFEGVSKGYFLTWQRKVQLRFYVVPCRRQKGRTFVLVFRNVD